TADHTHKTLPLSISHLFFSLHRKNRELHSLPTRRSSDLRGKTTCRVEVTGRQFAIALKQRWMPGVTSSGTSCAVQGLTPAILPANTISRRERLTTYSLNRSSISRRLRPVRGAPRSPTSLPSRNNRSSTRWRWQRKRIRYSSAWNSWNARNKDRWDS